MQPVIVVFWCLIEYDDTFYVQQQPIQFSREPDNVFTLSRTDVTFVCSIKTSNGFSDITWLYNNNTVIKAGSNYKISSNVQGRSILMIRNVSIQDEGDYHCCVSEWRTKIRSRPGRLHGKEPVYHKCWQHNVSVCFDDAMVVFVLMMQW